MSCRRAAPGGNEYPGRKKIRPRWGRIALVAGAAIVVLALLAGVGAYSYYRYVDAGLQRDDPFSQITDGRPAKVADGALNMLLLGSDSRDPDNKGKPGEWRTDTMIMLHIPASHDKAYLVSMPARPVRVRPQEQDDASTATPRPSSTRRSRGVARR